MLKVYVEWVKNHNITPFSHWLVQNQNCKNEWTDVENVGYRDQGILNHFHLWYACPTKNFVRPPFHLRPVGTISIKNIEKC